MSSNLKPWSLGLLILIMFSVLGELSLVFSEYVFHRLGINRDEFMMALWVLPFIASFIATYYSTSLKLVVGLSYLILFPLIGSIGHYLNGELGGVVDFTGISGAMTTFKVYLSIGSIVILIGAFLGVALSKGRPDS